MDRKDPDIVEMDFPPYMEEYSPFPDVETDFNFEDNKEEIYLRNTELVKKINARLAAEEAQQNLQQQNYRSPYRSGGLFNFIEDFLSLFSPNRTVDLNKMSWQIVKACAVIAGIIFLIMVAVMW